MNHGKRSLSSCVIVLVIAAGGCASTMRASEPTAPSFRAAVESHLAAIPARNLEALIPTLTSGEKLTLIFPDGEKLDTRQQFIDFHKTWFADDGWTMQPEIVELVESPTLGHALVRYHYQASNPDGSPRSSDSRLALTFALEQGSWRLVFDQNTRIAPSP